MKINMLSEGGGWETWVFVGVLALLVIALLVVPMFTNKKRAKQTAELHNSLKPGDVIKTVGGMIGTIKEIRQISAVDKEMVIETGEGENKCTMTFDIQALYQILSRSNAPAPVADETEADLVAESEVKPEVSAEPEKPAIEKEEIKAEEPVQTEKPAEVSAEAETVATDEAPAAAEAVAKAEPVKAATPAKKKPVKSANAKAKK